MLQRGMWVLALLLACSVGESWAARAYVARGLQTEISPQPLNLNRRRAHKHRRRRHRMLPATKKHDVQQKQEQTNTSAANNSNSALHTNAGTAPNRNGQRRRRYDPERQPPEKATQPSKRPPGKDVP